MTSRSLLLACVAAAMGAAASGFAATFAVTPAAAPVEGDALDSPGSVRSVPVQACSVVVADVEAGMAIIRDCAALFCDGYETGNAILWSAAVGGR